MKQTIYTQPEDTVEITIECEGRSPVYIKITPIEGDRRFVDVRTPEDGGCGTTVDEAISRRARANKQ